MGDIRNSVAHSWKTFDWEESNLKELLGRLRAIRESAALPDKGQARFAYLLGQLFYEVGS